MFCFSWYGYHRDLHVLTHSFPTRRSSDLSWTARRPPKDMEICSTEIMRRSLTAAVARSNGRSEEHTSELQSLMRSSYAVFCLKKIKYTKHAPYNVFRM